MPSSRECRELVHRMFRGEVAPAVVRDKGLPPFTRRRGRKAQGSFDFEVGAPAPHDGAEALKAAHEDGQRRP
ncbi:MAG: hypothetical protein HS130_01060 [Deltaproteobacteria bacterium]|nr:hypothetical protein [Deltaproteobacteria bacterium]MCL4873824.1 hypothetical protein [bacterium]